MKIDEFLDSVNPAELNDQAEQDQTTSKPPVMPDSALISEHTLKALQTKITQGKPFTKTDDKAKEPSIVAQTPVAKPSPVAQKNESQQVATPIPPLADAKSELVSLISLLEQKIAKGNISECMAAYAYLKQASHRLIELTEADRKQLYDRILKADDMLSSRLAQIEMDAQESLRLIKESIGRAKTLHYLEAFKEYQALLKIVDKIPDVASNFKDDARSLVLQLYVDIVQQKLSDEQKIISTAHTKIMEDIVQARHLIQQSKFVEAKVLYQKSMGMYLHLPRGYLKEKSLLYKTIIALFNEISFSEKMSTLKTLMTQEAKPDAANSSMQDAYVLRAKYALKEGKLEQAQKDINIVLKQDPAHPKALELKSMVDKAPQNPSVVIQNKISRLEYASLHGPNEVALKELEQLERKYPGNSRILELKKKLLMIKDKKQGVAL